MGSVFLALFEGPGKETAMNKKQDLIKEHLEKSGGILNLIPVFVPRRFGSAGHRLKLHPDDYYALGTKRGSIKAVSYTHLDVYKRQIRACAGSGFSASWRNGYKNGRRG